MSHHNIHKYAWTSPHCIIHNQEDHVLVDKRRQISIIYNRSSRGADCVTDHGRNHKRDTVIKKGNKTKFGTT